MEQCTLEVAGHTARPAERAPVLCFFEFGKAEKQSHDDQSLTPLTHPAPSRFPPFFLAMLGLASGITYTVPPSTSFHIEESRRGRGTRWWPWRMRTPLPAASATSLPSVSSWRRCKYPAPISPRLLLLCSCMHTRGAPPATALHKSPRAHEQS